MNIQYVLPCYILLHLFFAVDSFTATGCSTIYPRFCYFALLPKVNIYHQNPFRIRRQRSGRIVERENYLSLYNDGVLKTSLLDDANDDSAAAVVVVNDKDDAAKGLPTDKRNGRDQRTQQKQQKQMRHSPKRSAGSQPITSAILRISYDGSAFSGWSDANKNQNVASISSSSHQRQRRQRNRRRGVEEFLPSQQRRRRNVEGVLKENLAKIFGAVDPNTRIVVEGCSRTDKGVHASCMIAQVYCLKSDYNNDSSNNRTVICGKRIPHPATPTDDLCFEVLPMNQNLSKIAFSLNRMSPPDIQITGISPTPYLDRTNNTGPFLTGNVNNNGEKTTKNIFHASLSSKSKTYEYRISTGCIYDPCFRKMVWHVGSSDLNIEKMKDACDLFQGTHDFSAFQGAPRGADEKIKRAKQRDSSSPSSTCICTVFHSRVDIQNATTKSYEEENYVPGMEPVTYFNIALTGDRFLYKMVRFIVGSIISVGNDKLEIEDIQRALKVGNWEIPNDPKNRRIEFPCAPAHGLSLTYVDYGNDVQFEWQPIKNDGN